MHSVRYTRGCLVYREEEGYKGKSSQLKTEMQCVVQFFIMEAIVCVFLHLKYLTLRVLIDKSVKIF